MPTSPQGHPLLRLRSAALNVEYLRHLSLVKRKKRLKRILSARASHVLDVLPETWCRATLYEPAWELAVVQILDHDPMPVVCLFVRTVRPVNVGIRDR